MLRGHSHSALLFFLCPDRVTEPFQTKNVRAVNLNRCDASSKSQHSSAINWPQGAAVEKPVLTIICWLFFQSSIEIQTTLLKPPGAINF